MGTALLHERLQEDRPDKLPDPRRRAIMESFLTEARPWALKTAKRKFPHIPDDLYEDVYQQACIEMLQRGPDSLDKRSLYAYLSRVMSGNLGRCHSKWVNDNVSLTTEDGEPIAIADTATEEPETLSDRRQLNALLSELMHARLLAPEKAVLQLQLGHGFDPEQVRDALDMTPRQYKRRRSEGLEKMRQALDDYMNGKVCEEHASLLTLAAMGEVPAGSADQLNKHLEHCGACRAELRRVKTTVRARMAFAPWPVALGMPGILAAKASAATAWFAGAGKGLGAAKLAATVGTVAAMSVGAAVATKDDPPVRDAVPAAAQTQTEKAASTAKQASRTANTAATAKTKQAAEAKRSPASSKSATQQTTGAATETTDNSGTQESPTSGTGDTVTGTAKSTTKSLTDTVKQTTDNLKKGLNKTVKKVPTVAPTNNAPLDTTIDKVENTVKETTDGLLGGSGTP